LEVIGVCGKFIEHQQEGIDGPGSEQEVVKEAWCSLVDEDGTRKGSKGACSQAGSPTKTSGLEGATWAANRGIG
jgi:hypothetical protein